MKDTIKVPSRLINHKHFANWLLFHRDNVEVIHLIIDEVREAKSLGITQVSIKTICGFIRWDITKRFKTSTGFKINDAYTSIYAEVIAYNFPELSDMFSQRDLRAVVEA